MSALSIPARSGLAAPRGSAALAAFALAVGLAIGVGAGISAQRPSITTDPVTVSGPIDRPTAGAPLAAWKEAVAGLSAATSRQDFAAQARFESQLASLMSARTIGAVYLEHEQIEASLQVARQRQDHAAIARFSQQLAELCGTGAVDLKLDFC